MDPSFDPTLDPTLDPTADPTSDPSMDPTLDPTHSAVADPTFPPTEVDSCYWDVSPGLSCNDNRNEICDSASDGCTYEFCERYAVGNGFNHFTYGPMQWCAMCVEDGSGNMLDEGQVNVAETLYSRVCESEENTSTSTECPTVDGYTVNCDQDCVGTESDSFWTESVSIDECSDLCSVSAECTGFTYRTTDGGKCKFYVGTTAFASMTDGRMCVTQN